MIKVERGPRVTQVYVRTKGDMQYAYTPSGIRIINNKNNYGRQRGN